MRLAWYAGASTALAAGVVISAFHQRANFYSAMVYLSQSNVCLMILINLVFLLYGTFMYGFQRVCFGQLRPAEVESLYEKGWFAVTETCLAMTIFREELGGFFLVMFTALVTGKVWGWIFDGRVEVLEQQPPANPRLFHARLIFSLFISLFYDTWLLDYAVKTVIQQAKPTMMVMFLFEFAILLVCTIQTSMRYSIALMEINITKKQVQQGLETRKKEVREQRAEMLRRREEGETTEAENEEALPDEEDVTEDDIEVPGWEAKGQYIMILDICADLVKLCIYTAFFFVLLIFNGLPIHIVRDLFLTTRSLLKGLNSLMRLRQAMRDLDKYADATEEELARENTCIICREEMRPWVAGDGQLERTRPKRLPCGHILHAGCLRSWMERQAVCPTCRRSVMLGDRPPPAANANGGDAVVFRVGLNMGGGNNQNQPPPAANGAVPGAPGFQNNAQPPPAGGVGLRMINLGPLRIGFGQGNVADVQNMVDRLAAPGGQVNGPAGAPAAGQAATAAPGASPADTIAAQLREIEARIQREFTALSVSQQEATTLRLLLLELQRIRELENIANGNPPADMPPAAGAPPPFAAGLPPGLPQIYHNAPLFPPQPPHFQHNMPPFVPPRIHSPSVMRLGADPNAGVIAAGSADLPEGVTLPPGWSLVPLQRLDGNTPGAAPVGVAPTSVSTTAHPTAPGAQSAPAEQAPSQSASADQLTPPSPTPTPPEDRNVVPIEQPQPVAPNWGGAAQFFRNNNTTTPQPGSEVAAEPSPAPAAEAAANGGAGDKVTGAPVAGSSERSDEPASNGNADKGKAKAVTVEEAEDEA